MKKRIAALILGLLMIFPLTVPALAEIRNGVYVLDEKEYLKEAELRSYQSQAKALSDQLNMDILYVQTYDRDLQKDAQSLNMGSRPDQIMLLDNDGKCDVVLFGAACALTQEHVWQLCNAYIVKPTYTEGVAAYLETAEEIVTDLNNSGAFEMYRKMAQEPSRMMDKGDLLDRAEEEKLLEQLDEISQRHQLDVVVVTVKNLEGQAAKDYAQTLFATEGYGFGAEHDGILLLVNAEDGSWHLHTSGDGTAVYTDEVQGVFFEQVAPQLNDGAYANGFQAFATMCDDAAAREQTVSRSNTAPLPTERFPFGKYLLGALVVGALAASFVVFSMKGQLKLDKKEAGATTDLKLTVNKDIFLYSTISRSKGASANCSTSRGDSHKKT